MYLKLLFCFPKSLGKAVQAGNNDPLIKKSDLSFSGRGEMVQVTFL